MNAYLNVTETLAMVNYSRVNQLAGPRSHYYMHGAAPIVQCMAASTFNPLSQQINLRTSTTIPTDVIRNVPSINLRLIRKA